ncbi:Monocarboxylate transporter 9 [Armadillidium vulgare]|nr:Monocarboxylate transporter 9 [Armadillidium vulgare]
MSLEMLPTSDENSKLIVRKILIIGHCCNSKPKAKLNFRCSFSKLSNDNLPLILNEVVTHRIGGAIAIAVSYIVVSRYFLKRRGFALAITGVGICLSTFISPLIANYLLEFYGFRGACLLYGALVLNQCVGGALFQPIHWHEKPSQSSYIESEQNEKREKLLHNSPKQSDIQIHVAEKNYTQILPTDKILDPSLQEERKSNVTSLYSTNSYGNFEVYLETTITKSQNQNIIAGNKIIGNVCKVVKKIMALTYESILTLKFLRVQIVCIGFGCLSLGNIIFLTWIPFAITHAGFSLEMSAWCISISSVANLTGRILMIFISDRKWFNDKFVYMLSTFSIGLFIAVFSFAREINLFLFCLSCWGFSIGVSHSVTPMIFISSVGVEIFPSVYGVASLTSGIIHVTLVPVIDYI